jgi:hypothetical protein
MTVKEIEAELAPMLAADVEQWLDDHPHDALCIALDGFERTQSTSLADDIQKNFADWCGTLSDPDATFAGRFGCVLLGRNKNRWHELYEKEWGQRIDEHRVGGLAEADARKFLESAATYHTDRGDLITAQNLGSGEQRHPVRGDSSAQIGQHPKKRAIQKKNAPRYFGGTSSSVPPVRGRGRCQPISML